MAPTRRRPRLPLALATLGLAALAVGAPGARAAPVDGATLGALRTELKLHGVAERRRPPLERLTRHALQDVERVLGARLEGTLRVDIVGSDRDFAAVLRAHGGSAGAEPWIAGLALLHDDRILVRLDGKGLLRTGEVVRHEIAHIAVHALAGQRALPRWYHEGVAMMVAGEATFERLRDAIGAGAFGQLDDLDGLESGFFGGRVAAERAYATAAGFLRFAVARTGNDRALADVHRAMALGLDFTPAFVATFGLPPDDLFALYVHYVGSAGSPWSLALSDSVLWSLLSVLSFFALGLAWWRRPRWRDEPMDLRAIAEAGDEAMRSGLLWDDPQDSPDPPPPPHPTPPPPLPHRWPEPPDHPPVRPDP